MTHGKQPHQFIVVSLENHSPQNEYIARLDEGMMTKIASSSSNIYIYKYLHSTSPKQTTNNILGPGISTTTHIISGSSDLSN